MRNCSKALRGCALALTLTTGLAVMPANAQIVHNDDVEITGELSVQSHMCVGLSCGYPIFDDTILVKDNRPRIRFDDTSVENFPANDWQITVNDAAEYGDSFFAIEDLTASKVPFVIEAGAASSSIYVNSSGDVGVGTSSPAKRLHVKMSTATNDAAAVFENAEAVRIDLYNNSTVNGGVATTWFMQADNDSVRSFKISKQGTGGAEVVINDRQNANGSTFWVDGSVEATSFVTTSTRSAKTDGRKVDPKDVLEKVAGLEIEQWRFKSEAEGVAHVGPYAEDFKQAFGLGRSDKSIELQDANGVALVAIQALYQEVQELKKQNLELRQKLEKN